MRDKRPTVENFQNRKTMLKTLSLLGAGRDTETEDEDDVNEPWFPDALPSPTA